MEAIGSSLFCSMNKHCPEKNVSISIHDAAADGDDHLLILEVIICLQVYRTVLYARLDMILVRLSMENLTDCFSMIQRKPLPACYGQTDCLQGNDYLPRLAYIINCELEDLSSYKFLRKFKAKAQLRLSAEGLKGADKSKGEQFTQVG